MIQGKKSLATPDVDPIADKTLSVTFCAQESVECPVHCFDPHLIILQKKRKTTDMATSAQMDAAALVELLESADLKTVSDTQCLITENLQKGKSDSSRL